MTFTNHLNNLKTNQKTIIFIIGSVVVLSLVLTLIQPFEYRSSCQLLIIQKYNPNLDAYAAARSAERLSKNLSKVIHTSSFFEKVMNSGFDLNDSFSKNEAKRRDQWRKKVTARVSRGTGMLKIDVYDRNKIQAKEFARATAYILVAEGQEYHGGGENVEVKLVDSPLTSRFPARPNFFLNIFTGLILGVIAGGSYLAVNNQHLIDNSDKKRFKNQNSRFKIQDSRFKNKELRDRNQESGIMNYEKEEIKDKVIDQTFQESQIFQVSPAVKKIFTMHDHLNQVVAF